MVLFAVVVVLLSVAVVLPNKETENSTTSVLGILTVSLALISSHKETQTILTALQNHFPVPFFGGFQLASPRTRWTRKFHHSRPGKHRHSRSTGKLVTAAAPSKKDHWNSFCIVLWYFFWTCAWVFPPATTPMNTPPHESRGHVFRVFGHFPATAPKNTRIHESRGSFSYTIPFAL